jgi:hypothetical protein
MPMRRMARIGTVALLLGWSAASVGCSDDSGPSGTPLVVAQTEDESGDGQVGRINEPLNDLLRVIVTREGQPVQNVEVQWVSNTGGTFAPGTTLTNSAGVAASSWILGPESGEQAASARVVGAEGSPVEFSASAVLPPPPGGGGGGEPQPIRLPVVR